MYPELFRIGNFVISSYGVMVALAFLVGYGVAEREFKRLGLPLRLLEELGVAIPIAAIVGAKLLYIVENVPLSEFLAHPVPHLFSRGGLTFYGGFFGGFLAAFLVVRRYPVSWRMLLGSLSPSLALGYAIGRVGCFLVGDDYGKRSDLPWAMAFPRGAPPTIDPVTGEVYRVHPTQLYEIALSLVIFAVLWRIRKAWTPERLGGLYLVLAGSERFLVEFLRVTTPSFIPGLSVAQLMALGLVGLGIWILRRGAL